MDFVILIGFLAAILTNVAFVPQVIKIWQTRHTEDISLVMYVLFVAGIFFWLIYGLYLDSIPVILANGITLVLSSIILALKIKHG